MALSDVEVKRYARQLLLPGFGPVSQAFLRAARVHVVGAGAVAGPALTYLAAAGVGTLAVDDGGEVQPTDAAHWLYPPDLAGQPRAFAAMAMLKGASGTLKPRAYASGFDATAVLVCPESPALAREAAERARQAGLPHVVAQGDGDGGFVVAVPPGAPCYTCAASSPGLPATIGAAATLGSLAALELLLLLAQAAQEPRGRRIELVRGQPLTRATHRMAGCACTPRA